MLNYRWAIRDIDFGKTYHFLNWQDLLDFVNGKTVPVTTCDCCEKSSPK